MRGNIKETITNQKWNQKPAPLSHGKKTQVVAACLEWKILVGLKLVLLKWLSTITKSKIIRLGEYKNLRHQK